jgi:hypothetical protein
MTPSSTRVWSRPGRCGSRTRWRAKSEWIRISTPCVYPPTQSALESRRSRHSRLHSSKITITKMITTSTPISCQSVPQPTSSLRAHHAA